MGCTAVREEESFWALLYLAGSVALSGCTFLNQCQGMIIWCPVVCWNQGPADIFFCLVPAADGRWVRREPWSMQGSGPSQTCGRERRAHVSLLSAPDVQPGCFSSSPKSFRVRTTRLPFVLVSAQHQASLKFLHAAALFPERLFSLRQEKPLRLKFQFLIVIAIMQRHPGDLFRFSLNCANSCELQDVTQSQKDPALVCAKRYGTLEPVQRWSKTCQNCSCQMQLNTKDIRYV